MTDVGCKGNRHGESLTILKCSENVMTSKIPTRQPSSRGTRDLQRSYLIILYTVSHEMLLPIAIGISMTALRYMSLVTIIWKDLNEKRK